MGDIKLKKTFLKGVLLSLLVFALFSFKTESTMSQQMSDYCYVPPSTPAQEVKPNVLFVVDFSGSMQFPTYVPCTFNGYTQQKVAKCGTNTASYNSTQTYWGYFDPDKCYQPTNQGFVETSCNCSRNIQNMTSSCISGNLLNWVTTTRIDAARKVLTGGKAPQEGADRGKLISEGSIYTIEYEYTINDSTKKCIFTITATQPDSRKITIQGQNCQIKLNNIDIKINLPSNAQVKGIIHDICDTSDLNGQINEKCKAIIEFMIFASDDREGEILVGKNATISNLISAINNAQPYWGTPTGEALWEAYDYYKQRNDHPYEANTQHIGRANVNKDPYYDRIGNKDVPVWCRKGFVLLISDGAWNGDVDPVIPARVMATTDLREDLESTQSVITYVIYAWGDLDNTARLEGQRAMITTAIFGGFEDYDNNKWPYPFVSYNENAQGTCNYGGDSTRRSNISDNTTTYCNSRGVSYPLSKCNPNGNWDNLCAEWDTVSNSPKDGLPYNYYEANDIEGLRAAILNALYDILRRASSQAAVACLTSRSGLSSIVIQPYYFPKFQSQKGERSWLGFLKALWIDAKLQLREDTLSNKILNLLGEAFDKIIQFITGAQGTKVAVLQGNELTDNNSCSVYQLKDINEVISVFDSGCILAESNPNERRIFFNSGNETLDFISSDNNVVNLLSGIWGTTPEEARCVIRYLRGENLSNDLQCNIYDSVRRPREVLKKEVCISGDNEITWRLGDIISSTPSLVSEQPVNIYHLKYWDKSYRAFISSQEYKRRPTFVFVSSNDGMLHAFRVGYLKPGENAGSPVKLVNAPGTEESDLVGKEEWAFIPKNALPYMKWYGNPNYCHIPTVDYRTLVVDAKLNGSWKTLLIGAMGFGGKEMGSFSSSLFVLDVTDPLNPRLLWERSLDDKTLTLSMPAVVKVKENWYVALGSGPKEPEGKNFVGAKIYFFDLGTGNKVVEIPLKENNQALIGAVGDLMPVDVDGDYSDDAIYFGVYTQTSGDFYRLRLRSGESYKEISSLVSSDITKAVSISRPIFAASAFAKGPDGKLWVYFGTGRFLSGDDKLINYSNYLVGFKDGAWDTKYEQSSLYRLLTDFQKTNPMEIISTVLGYQNVCICNESGCSLQSVVRDTSPINPQVSPVQGWYFELPKEVIISQPAILGKTVEAVSYKPSDDICAYLGESNLISLYYLTGTANPRPVVLSPLATSPAGEGRVKVNPKISLGLGSPPLGNPFQVLGGSIGRKYAKLVQISGTLLKIEQQIAEPLRGRIIHWVER